MSGFSLASLLGDHMVLQRGRPHPLWGWDDPGVPVYAHRRRQRRDPRRGERGDGARRHVAARMPGARAGRPVPLADPRQRRADARGRRGGRGVAGLGPVEHGVSTRPGPGRRAGGSPGAVARASYVQGRQRGRARAPASGRRSVARVSPGNGRRVLGHRLLLRPRARGQTRGPGRDHRCELGRYARRGLDQQGSARAR